MARCWSSMQNINSRLRKLNVAMTVAVMVILCAAFIPTTTALGDHTVTPYTLSTRRVLKDGQSTGRRRLTQCDTCPSMAEARATCSAAGASQSSIRAELISKCGTSGFNPSACCTLQQSSQWNVYAACACADTIPGLSAFVSGSTIVSTCGCGYSGQSQSGTTTTTTSSSISSSFANMQQVYNAVSFSSGSSGGGSGSGSNSNSNSSG